jgi:GNAT superfamily N-acetyltransferase
MTMEPAGVRGADSAPDGSGIDESAPFSIRRAEPRDVRSIAEFQKIAWQQAYRGILSASYLGAISVETLELDWDEYLANGTRSIAIAHDGVRILGVVSWGPADHPSANMPELELKSIYVDESHSGIGIGSALLEEALGDRAAHLWMFEGNDRAAAFYQLHGFVPDDGRLHDDDADAWEVRYVRWN